MANSFKTDDSFLRKLAIGASGTKATIVRLKELGFKPIELERGSTGFKIWKKIKIKRVRVPDILCLKTGIRFESRGKTKPEISMSHSQKDPERVWDAGMRDDDFVTITVFEQSDDSPINFKRISPVHFVNVQDMRQAFNKEQILITKPKGAEEGFEVRVIWPCAASKCKAVISTVEEINRLILSPTISEGKRKQIVYLMRKKGKMVLLPYVKVGDIVEANQIVAAVVPVFTTLNCHKFNEVDENYFIDKLTNNFNLSERYAAAKALRYSGYKVAKNALESRMTDPDEDIYVQLEAAAALAAHDDPKGWEFMKGKLSSPTMIVPLETQLETVIVLSEIPKEQSEELLIEVLKDNKRNEELRAGAAWALGQFTSLKAATALVDTFNLSTLEIKVEAARALLRIADPQRDNLVNLLKDSEISKRDGISWVLARTGKFNPSDLIKRADDNLRRWISYIIGYGKDNFAQADIEKICKADPEVYFAASVLWQIMASWVNGLEEY